MGKYQDFWRVSEQALEFSIHRFGLQVSPKQRGRLPEAWLHPSPHREVAPCARSPRHPLCSQIFRVPLFSDRG